MGYNWPDPDDFTDPGGTSPQEQPDYGVLTNLAEAIEPPVRVTVTFTESGYYWSVAVSGDDGDDVLRRIRGIDMELRQTYRQELGVQR